MSFVIRSGANFTRNLTISKKQLTTIKNAQSLEEATKLKFIDRILDKLFSRNKAEVHKQLYYLFQDSSPCDAEDIINKTQAFDRLTQLVDSKRRSHLNISVTQAKWGEQSNTVAFKFQLQGIPFELEFSFNNLPEEISPKSVARQWLMAEQGKRLMLHHPNEGWQQLMEQLQQSAEEVLLQVHHSSRDITNLESDDVYPNSVSEEDKSAFQEMLQLNKREDKASSMSPTDAGKKILRNYRAFKENKAAALDRAKATGDKHTVLTHKDGTRYYVDPNGLFPMMRRPLYRPTSDISGSSSKLDRADDEYLRFTHVFESDLDKTMDPTADIDLSERSRLDEHFEKQMYFIEDLQELEQALPGASFKGRSIQPGMLGTLDSQGRRLAVNGGENTEVFVQRTQRPIPLQAFKIACEDLSAAHEHQIYFRDIKNANMVYRESRTGKNGQTVPIDDPKVHFIDLEEMCTPNSGGLTKECGTPTFMTSELADAKLEGDKSLIKAADNYAMLLSLLRGVSVTVMNEVPTYSYSEQFGEEMFTHGILHEQSNSAEHREVLTQVLKQIIKPEQLEQVQNFLREPTEYPLAQPLVDVINWQVSL